MVLKMCSRLILRQKSTFQFSKKLLNKYKAMQPQGKKEWVSQGVQVGWVENTLEKLHKVEVNQQERYKLGRLWHWFSKWGPLNCQIIVTWELVRHAELGVLEMGAQLPVFDSLVTDGKERVKPADPRTAHLGVRYSNMDSMMKPLFYYFFSISMLESHY